MGHADFKAQPGHGSIDNCLYLSTALLPFSQMDKSNFSDISDHQKIDILLGRIVNETDRNTATIFFDAIFKDEFPGEEPKMKNVLDIMLYRGMVEYGSNTSKQIPFQIKLGRYGRSIQEAGGWVKNMDQEFIEAIKEKQHKENQRKLTEYQVNSFKKIQRRANISLVVSVISALVAIVSIILSILL